MHFLKCTRVMCKKPWSKSLIQLLFSYSWSQSGDWSSSCFSSAVNKHLCSTSNQQLNLAHWFTSIFFRQSYNFLFIIFLRPLSFTASPQVKAAETVLVKHRCLFSRTPSWLSYSPHTFLLGACDTSSPYLALYSGSPVILSPLVY